MTNKISIPLENRDLEELENLLLSAERHARNYVYSEISPKEIEDLAVSIEIDDAEEFTLNCTIEIELTKGSQLNAQKISEDALAKLFEFIEKELKIQD